jgi:hypothetical protein
LWFWSPPSCWSILLSAAGTTVCNLSEELARVDWCMDVFTFSRHSWSVFSTKHFKTALFINPRSAEFSVELRSFEFCESEYRRSQKIKAAALLRQTETERERER